MIQVDGFESKEDLTDLDRTQLAHRVIDGVIHIAHMESTTIEQILVDLLESHRTVKNFRDMF